MYAVILAGGSGSRCWPLSRRHKPKHLLSLYNEKTLIENTIKRLEGLSGLEGCLIVTTKDQKDAIAAVLPGFCKENIICEPFGKDTAAAIGFAAMNILDKDSDALMLILPCDHFIKEDDNQEFLSILEKACKKSKSYPDTLFTIGIKPTYPETGYGYIQIDKKIEPNFYSVANFAEKPNLHTAERFVKDGDFYWNSGIFIWKARTIVEKIRNHMPDLYDVLSDISRSFDCRDYETILSEKYSKLKDVSIDYGIMEKEKDVKMLQGEFSWSDVGSWLEIHKLKDKDISNNHIRADYVGLDSEDCLIISEENDKLITTIGLKNIAVINTSDTIMVMDLNKSQEVKDLVYRLKARKLLKYL